MGEKLNILLLGTTGQGKSATGNFLLDRNTFKTSAGATSLTKEVDYGFRHFDDLTLVIVDGPGLVDTDMSSYEDKKSAAKNMSKALAMCYDGIDCFIYVLKFGNRFTAQDRDALEDLKRIFGPTYLDNVIVVLTHGHIFEEMNEDEKVKITFTDYCKQQKGNFHKLYIDCKERFLLFENKEKNPEKKRAQIEGLVKLAQEIKRNKGRYTSQCFDDAKREREKMIVEAHAPELKKEIQEKVSLFIADIEKYAKAPTDTERIRIRKDIVDLKEEIKKEDDGHGVLNEILQLVAQVSENMHDANRLVALAEKLEETRKSKNSWTKLGAVCTVVGGAVCLVAAAPVAVTVAAAAAIGGSAVSGVSAVGTGISYLAFGKKEREIEKEKKKVEDRLAKNKQAKF